MESGQTADENLLFFNPLRQHLCRHDRHDSVLIRPDGQGSSKDFSFLYLPTIRPVGIEALDPIHDPVYCGRLPPCGSRNFDTILGPIQPPKRVEGMWLQVCRYGAGVSLEDIADYIMDQLIPGPFGWETSRKAPEAQPTSAENPLRNGPFWVVVEPSLAVATIDKILNLHLLHCNTSRGEVAALVYYYVNCFVEESKLSLPYLPKTDRGLLCLWKPEKTG